MGAPIIRYEAGQTAYPFEAMTDSGDATTFGASFAPLSDVAGAEAAILTDHLRDSAISGDKSAEMALVLQQRANAHIAAYMVRARKAGKVS
jgi:hypothetical protein